MSLFNISACYIIGSVPISVLISKYILNQDMRSIGSGNIGATNAYRVHGIFFAILIGAIDIAKGFISMQYFIPNNIGMLAVTIGQTFPMWLMFKGGKGMAVYFGTLAYYDLPMAIALGMIWMTITKFLHQPFVATISAALLSFMIGPCDVYKIATILLIIIRHSSNIKKFMGI
jgi:glycerol-3-phosphate acyltransferase PlsY